MTNAWFLGAQHSVPQSENEVRSTVEPIRTDGQNSELTRAPDWNEKDTDDSGQLVGLSPREKSGDTHDTEKYVPWWVSLASNPHNIITDQQVASSGTAAKREENGVQGHGTMQYTETIDPVIRDAAKLGNETFVRDEEIIQAGAGSYMNPVDTDNWNAAVAGQTAERQSRESYQSTLWNAWLNG